jgi:ABC-type transport system involved in multi-copper enzyme maturation permease subunit
MVRGSNTRQAWQERLSEAGLAAGGLALLVHGADLPGWQRAGAWALLVLAGAVLLRRGWVRLCGPVLWYDLVRNTRRGRTFGLRCLYLALLLAALAVMYANWSHSGRWWQPVRSRDAARFALAFFETFACTQLALVVLLTPAYTAGAVAEEKESRTLEFVLATDLRDHEIVLGKLLSRVAHLALLVLAGLPFLSALQLLGGVDPNLVLGAFAGTGLTLVSLGALSILASVLARRARDALLLAYLTLAAYAVVCGLGSLLLHRYSQALPFPVRALVQALQAGSPIHALVRLSEASIPVDRGLPWVLRDYALFHALVAVVCVLGAVARLRVTALREPRPRGRRLGKWARLRGRVGERPMVWKEVWADPGWGLRWPGRLLLAGLVLASFAPLWFIAEEAVRHPWHPWHLVEEELNVWVRAVGTLVACLALLAVAVRAAGSICGERDRDTLDSLLTTPLTGEEILFGKWLGSITGVRWLALWVGVIWGLAVLGGGLSILAVPLLVVAWLVYAAALSSVGLCFSAVCRSTRRAIGLAVLATLGLGVGHWLLWLCCLPGPKGDVEPLLKFQAGLTPPVVLGLCLPFRAGDFDRHLWQLQAEMIGFAVAGTLCWAALAWVLWVNANGQFKERTGRCPTLPPAQAARPAPAAPAPSARSPAQDDSSPAGPSS